MHYISDLKSIDAGPPYSRTKIYAVRMSCGSSTVDRYLLRAPAPDLSSKPAGRRCCCQSMGQTDGQTNEHCSVL